MGYQMLGVAVAWQMYALTGSAFDLGLVGLMQFLPAAAFMLVAGQIADRYDRRRLLQICQTVEGLAAAALAVGLLLRLGEQGVASWRRYSSSASGAHSRRRPSRPCCRRWCRRRCFRARWRPRRRRPSSPPSPVRRSAASSMRSVPTVPYTTCCAALSRIGHPARLRARRALRRDALADQPGGILRRRLLHPPQPDRARRHLARPVRGAARRHHRAAADLRRRGLSRRLGRPRAAARRAGRRRAGDHGRADALAADAARRPHHVRERRLLRARDHRVRHVDIVRAVDGGIGGAGRIGRGERGDPHDAGADRDPRRDARPRQRGEFAVRRHLQSARRFPRRRDGGLAGRHSGGAGGRRRDFAGGADLDASVSRRSLMSTVFILARRDKIGE